MDWEKVLQEFMNREKNNQIVVEFYPPYSDIISDEISTDEALSPIQVRLDTEYVMEGDAAWELEILEKPKDSQAD